MEEKEDLLGYVTRDRYSRVVCSLCLYINTIIVMLHSVPKIWPHSRRQCRRFISISKHCCQKSASNTNNSPKSAPMQQDDVSHIRNIGILAHIDAGKTTTTERMLYYSGKISNMGEVHHGNTVTDYLEQERARGITITSAAVSFPWCNYSINLVDTPGHIDFTVEVEQTLSVLDGAVVVLDASAGVEAQTSTVWQQADRYGIPRIVYANKMDRGDSCIELCAQTLRSKLGADVAQLQLPIKIDSQFRGVVDIIQLQKSIWEERPKSGSQFECNPLTEEDGTLYLEALEVRDALTDQLAMLDDTLAEQVLEVGSLNKVSAQALISSMRRVTILQKAVPLFCGSSYRNIGVQPVMDAVIRYLPSPLERWNRRLQDSFGSELCARAFKTTHHPHLGPLVFFRIYSGKITQNERIFNTRLGKNEQVSKLFHATADETEEVKQVTQGNIAVLAGLKATMTGDLVCSTQMAATRAKQNMEKKIGISSEEASREIGERSKIPDPVFFCTVEPTSQAYQIPLDNALQKLQREDPSLRVNLNGQTGQIELGGMGELHIDIIRERILSEHKVKASLGPLQIAYKETLREPIQESASIDQLIGGVKQSCSISLTLIPEEKTPEPNKLIKVDTKGDNYENIRNITHADIALVRTGAQRAFSHGPRLGGEVIRLSVLVHKLARSRITSESVVITAVSRCILQALKKRKTNLLEPIMRLEIVLPPDLVNAVVSDLHKRRAQIHESDTRRNYQVVVADAPLCELLGYSNSLRILTSGKASFTMEFLEYQEMSADEEVEAIKRETGFYPLD